MLAWFALIVLGLAWELWISPLRSGGSWLALKVVPLVLLAAPLLRASTYALQVALMLVLIYVFEGAARLLEPAPARWLAATEFLLALVFFVARSFICGHSSARRWRDARQRDGNNEPAGLDRRGHRSGQCADS